MSAISAMIFSVTLGELKIKKLIYECVSYNLNTAVINWIKYLSNNLTLGDRRKNPHTGVKIQDIFTEVS